MYTNRLNDLIFMSYFTRDVIKSRERITLRSELYIVLLTGLITVLYMY